MPGVKMSLWLRWGQRSVAGESKAHSRISRSEVLWSKARVRKASARQEGLRQRRDKSKARTRQEDPKYTTPSKHLCLPLITWVTKPTHAEFHRVSQARLGAALGMLVSGIAARFLLMIPGDLGLIPSGPARQWLLCALMQSHVVVMDVCIKCWISLVLCLDVCVGFFPSQ